jgi:hypothetical protein
MTQLEEHVIRSAVRQGHQRSVLGPKLTGCPRSYARNQNCTCDKIISRLHSGNRLLATNLSSTPALSENLKLKIKLFCVFFCTDVNTPSENKLIKHLKCVLHEVFSTAPIGKHYLMLVQFTMSYNKRMLLSQRIYIYIYIFYFAQKYATRKAQRMKKSWK